MGKSEFDTHMNLESSDANLLKYPINFLFSNTIITINLCSMPLDLKSFAIFVPIPII